MDELSSKAICSILTSLFPSTMIEALAREHEVVVRDRKIDVRMLVWTLVVGFAVGGEARSIAGYRRAYEAATDQSIFPSSFYDRFTEELARLLCDLLDHIVIWESSEGKGVIYRNFYCKSSSWSNMPPDGYTTVTISDSVATKLTRIMMHHDRSSDAEAITYAADTTLVQEDEITIQELIQLLADRIDEVDETSLR
jgi:hypothetical protein